MPELDYTKISLDTAFDIPEKTQEVENENETPTNEQEVEAQEVNTANTEEEATSEEFSLYRTLNEKLGFEIDGEFSEDEDGLIQYTSEVGKRFAEQAVNDIFGEFEEVKEFYNFLKEGGDPQEYLSTVHPEVDYSKMEIAEDNEDTQERIVREHLKLQKFSNEEIDQTIKELKQSDLLLSQSTRSLRLLQEHQKEGKNELKARLAAQKEQQEKEAKAFWDDVSTKVTKSSDLSGIPLPEAKKKDFLEYLQKPVKDGKSQALLDAEGATLDQLLAVELLRFNKYDLSGLIKRTASTQNAEKLKSLFEKKRDDTPGGGMGESRQQTPNFSRIDVL